MFDASSPTESIRQSAIRLLRICVSSLYEMSRAWARSHRAIEGLRLLAREWDLSISESLFLQSEAAFDIGVISADSGEAFGMADSSLDALADQALASEADTKAEIESVTVDMAGSSLPVMTSWISITPAEPLDSLHDLDHEVDPMMQPWLGNYYSFWDMEPGQSWHLTDSEI